MIKNLLFFSCGLPLFCFFCLFLTGSSIMMIFDKIFHLFFGTLINYLYQKIVNNEKIKNLYKNEGSEHYFPRSIIYGSVALINFIFAIYYWHTFGYNQYFMYYLVLYYLIWLGPYNRGFSTVAVMAHKEGHMDKKRIYNSESKILNHLFEHYIGVFYGIVPDIFSMVHNKIHHIYHGGYGDTVTNWDCERNNIIHFVWYLTRFLLHSIGLTGIVHFMTAKKYDFAKRYAFSVFWYWSIVLLTGIIFDWTFCFCFMIIPLIFTNCMFASNNWSWHCFLTDEKNPFMMNTVIENGDYNLWGEDYHYNHHKEPLVNWTSAEQNWEIYKAEAIKNETEHVIIKYTNLVIIFLLCISRQHWILSKISNLSSKRIKETLEKIPEIPHDWQSYYYYF